MKRNADWPRLQRRAVDLGLVLRRCASIRLAAGFFPTAKMDPGKLFRYLEGNLPPAERAALEEQLISDKQLQRELAVARQIHAGMRGDSREVLLPPAQDVITEQGRKMALRVGA